IGKIGLHKSHPEDHREYVMFHGCSKEGAELIKRDGFKPSSADRMLGAGVYVSRDIRKAFIRYPLNTPLMTIPDSDRMVLKVKVDVGRVKVIKRQRHPMQKTWHTEHGFDTAWVPPNVGMVPSNQEEDCVYDPKRIKVLAMLKVPNLKK
uniref:PARP catalytic domain-containing protein n=1 Tax=Oncorhynchus mykiss TaxID=8022 RepID=A0A8C7P197_ONCMY